MRRENLEWLAWFVLLASFFTCVSLSIATPLSIRWYLRNARVRQQVSLEVPRDPLSVTWGGRGRTVSVSEDTDGVSEGTIVATNATSGRLIVRTPQVDNGSLIASVQIYADAEIVLSSARSPRFSISRLPHEVVLEVRSGRVYVNVLGDRGRPTEVEVRTGQGRVMLREGRYIIEAGQEEAEVGVREGLAEVFGDGDLVQLSVGERAIVEGGGRIRGPLSAPSNLIANGDFHAALDGWDIDKEQDEAPAGSVDVITTEGRRVVSLRRDGIDHAEVAIRQVINRDVRKFTSLELHLELQVREQNVPLCGTRGSECPVMVRVEYQDAYGASREWLQGFYWLPKPSGSDYPSVCELCSTRNPHIQVQKDTWYPYLSLNLVQLLSQDGKAPTMIEAITIYASGHTFESRVAEVELIGEE